MFLLINNCSDVFLRGHFQGAQKFVQIACQVAIQAAKNYELLKMTKD
jgi:hypothetical protein